LRFGWESFSRTLAAAGASEAARWLGARAGDPDLIHVAEPLLEAAVSPEPEEAAEGLSALAELAEEIGDDLMADTLWEGVLARARDAGDGDFVFEATRRLAAIAERLGDPLAAAEFFIAFLNWRREEHHSADPDDVLDAFGEIARLAGIDGARKAAAEYEYRQAAFARLLEVDDPRAVEGDWEPGRPPFAPWE
jgi:hypothetical protein